MRGPALIAGLLSFVAAGLLSGCATASGALTPLGRGRVIQVVAGENFWGSLARQVGGSHVHVTSIIVNPATDPHGYEPTAADARAVASARLVIENGAGYDPWLPRLVAAGSGAQMVLDVGRLAGVANGANPHLWYRPADVRAFIGRLAADYARIDPADAGYFARRRDYVQAVALRQYQELISAIRTRYAGTRVGASESIFAMLAPSLGLRLSTPPSFLRAVTEGTEPSVSDEQAIARQISRRLIKVYVYNSQNVTPDVQAQLAAAGAAGIPVAVITETMVPAAGTFQGWQVRQLRGIEAALARATGH